MSSNNNKPIKLYGFLESQPVRSVIILCKMNNIPYDLIVVDVTKDDHLKPEYKAIHPAQKVPAIDEEGLGVLGECSAILIYLCETRNLSQWYPTAPVLKARTNYWLSWNNNNTRLLTTGLLKPSLAGLKDEIALMMIKKSLTYLENELVNRKYLVPGDHPTIADIVLITEIDTVETCKMLDLSPYPSIKKWMQDVRAALPAVYDDVLAPVAIFSCTLGCTSNL